MRARTASSESDEVETEEDTSRQSPHKSYRGFGRGQMRGSCTPRSPWAFPGASNVRLSPQSDVSGHDARVAMSLTRRRKSAGDSLQSLGDISAHRKSAYSTKMTPAPERTRKFDRRSEKKSETKRVLLADNVAEPIIVQESARWQLGRSLRRTPSRVSSTVAAMRALEANSREVSRPESPMDRNSPSQAPGVKRRTSARYNSDDAANDLCIAKALSPSLMYAGAGSLRSKGKRGRAEFSPHKERKSQPTGDRSAKRIRAGADGAVGRSSTAYDGDTLARPIKQEAELEEREVKSRGKQKVIKKQKCPPLHKPVGSSRATLLAKKGEAGYMTASYPHSSLVDYLTKQKDNKTRLRLPPVRFATPSDDNDDDDDDGDDDYDDDKDDDKYEGKEVKSGGSVDFRPSRLISNDGCVSRKSVSSGAREKGTRHNCQTRSKEDSSRSKTRCGGLFDGRRSDVQVSRAQAEQKRPREELKAGRAWRHVHNHEFGVLERTRRGQDDGAQELGERGSPLQNPKRRLKQSAVDCLQTLPNGCLSVPKSKRKVRQLHLQRNVKKEFFSVGSESDEDGTVSEDSLAPESPESVKEKKGEDEGFSDSPMQYESPSSSSSSEGSDWADGVLSPRLSSTPTSDDDSDYVVERGKALRKRRLKTDKRSHSGSSSDGVSSQTRQPRRRRGVTKQQRRKARSTESSTESSTDDSDSDYISGKRISSGRKRRPRRSKAVPKPAEDAENVRTLLGLRKGKVPVQYTEIPYDFELSETEAAQSEVRKPRLRKSNGSRISRSKGESLAIDDEENSEEDDIFEISSTHEDSEGSSEPDSASHRKIRAQKPSKGFKQDLRNDITLQWLAKHFRVTKILGVEAHTKEAAFASEDASAFEGTEYVDPLFTDIDRIIAVHELGRPLPRRIMDNATNRRLKTFADWNRQHRHKDYGRKVFLVKWKGTPYCDATWEFEEDINNEEAIEEYYRRQKPPKRPGVPPHDSAKLRSSTKMVLYKEGERLPSFKNDGLLRPYQLEGLNWLLFNWYHGRNSILGDEMGLGKTLQIVSFIQHLINEEKHRGPYLIVAPLSTIGHWAKEFNTWTDINAVVYYGNEDSRRLIRQCEFHFSGDRPGGFVAGSLTAWKKRRRAGEVSWRPGEMRFKCPVVITTYETLNYNAHLQQIDWQLLVVDEAHRLKNRKTRTMARIMELSCEDMVIMTGTPIQNNVKELWTLLNLVAPEVFSRYEEFEEKYGELRTHNQLDALHEELRPYLLRRVKEDVEKSLPKKEETLIEVELTLLQKKYYRAIIERNLDFLTNMGKIGAASIPRLANIFMELRKCCNHPFLLNGVEQKEMDEVIVGSPLLKEKAEAIRAEGKLQTSEEIQAQLEVEALVVTSGKLILVDKLLPRLQKEGHRVLLFSQFTTTLDILEDYLNGREYKFARIDGSVLGNDRQRVIDRFNEPGSSYFIMLLSTRAGGVGINLTSANTVIIYDSDWNPQNDLQAQARCHRIGQSSDVKVYRLLSANTYEKTMLHKASIKLGLDQAVLRLQRGARISKDSGKRKLTRGEEARELERLLRHGVYDVFNEAGFAESESRDRKFYEEDIENILRRSTTVTHDPRSGDDSSSNSSLQQSSSFSKATFVSSFTSEGQKFSMDDPDFWTKVAGPERMRELEAKNSNLKGDGLEKRRRAAEKARDVYLDRTAAQYGYISTSESEEEKSKKGKRRSRSKQPREGSGEGAASKGGLSSPHTRNSDQKKKSFKELLDEVVRQVKAKEQHQSKEKEALSGPDMTNEDASVQNNSGSEGSNYEEELNASSSSDSSNERQLTSDPDYEQQPSDEESSSSDSSSPSSFEDDSNALREPKRTKKTSSSASRKQSLERKTTNLTQNEATSRQHIQREGYVGYKALSNTKLRNILGAMLCFGYGRWDRICAQLGTDNRELIRDHARSLIQLMAFEYTYHVRREKFAKERLSKQLKLQIEASKLLFQRSRELGVGNQVEAAAQTPDVSEGSSRGREGRKVVSVDQDEEESQGLLEERNASNHGTAQVETEVLEARSSETRGEMDIATKARSQEQAGEGAFGQDLDKGDIRMHPDQADTSRANESRVVVCEGVVNLCVQNCKSDQEVGASSDMVRLSAEKTASLRVVSTSSESAEKVSAGGSPGSVALHTDLGPRDEVVVDEGEQRSKLTYVVEKGQEAKTHVSQVENSVRQTINIERGEKSAVKAPNAIEVIEVDSADEMSSVTNGASTERLNNVSVSGSVTSPDPPPSATVKNAIDGPKPQVLEGSVHTEHIAEEIRQEISNSLDDQAKVDFASNAQGTVAKADAEKVSGQGTGAGEMLCQGHIYEDESDNEDTALERGLSPALNSIHEPIPYVAVVKAPGPSQRPTPGQIENQSKVEPTKQVESQNQRCNSSSGFFTPVLQSSVEARTDEAKTQFTVNQRDIFELVGPISSAYRRMAAEVLLERGLIISKDIAKVSSLEGIEELKKLAPGFLVLVAPVAVASPFKHITRIKKYVKGKLEALEEISKFTTFVETNRLNELVSAWDRLSEHPRVENVPIEAPLHESPVKLAYQPTHQPYGVPYQGSRANLSLDPRFHPSMRHWPQHLPFLEAPSPLAGRAAHGPIFDVAALNSLRVQVPHLDGRVPVAVFRQAVSIRTRNPAVFAHPSATTSQWPPPAYPSSFGESTVISPQRTSYIPQTLLKSCPKTMPRAILEGRLHECYTCDSHSVTQSIRRVSPFHPLLSCNDIRYMIPKLNQNKPIWWWKPFEDDMRLLVIAYDAGFSRTRLMVTNLLGGTLGRRMEEVKELHKIWLEWADGLRGKNAKFSVPTRVQSNSTEGEASHGDQVPSQAGQIMDSGSSSSSVADSTLHAASTISDPKCASTASAMGPGIEEMREASENVDSVKPQNDAENRVRAEESNNNKGYSSHQSQPSQYECSVSQLLRRLPVDMPSRDALHKRLQYVSMYIPAVRPRQ